MRRWRKILLIAALVALLGIGWHDARHFREERAHLAVAREQAAARAAELAAWRSVEEAAQRELAEAERQLAALSPAVPSSSVPEAARAEERQAWLARVKRLKQVFAERPDQQVPEMALLEESDWLRVAQKPLEHPVEVRGALAQVRNAAESKFAIPLRAALAKYVEAGNDVLLEDIMALAPYFNPPADPAMLARYEIIRRATTNGGVPIKGPLAVRLRAPIDEIYDSRTTYSVGMLTGGSGLVVWTPDFSARAARARQAYLKANPNTQGNPPHLELLRFFDPPLPRDAIERAEFDANRMERQAGAGQSR